MPEIHIIVKLSLGILNRFNIVWRGGGDITLLGVAWFYQKIGRYVQIASGKHITESERKQTNKQTYEGI